MPVKTKAFKIVKNPLVWKLKNQDVWHEYKRPWTLYWLLQTQLHFPLVRVPGPRAQQPSGLLREESKAFLLILGTNVTRIERPE